MSRPQWPDSINSPSETRGTIHRGIGSLVCQMVEGDLEERRVSLSRAVCVECDLIIPKNTPFLADAICQDQVEQNQERILRDFGIA